MLWFWSLDITQDAVIHTISITCRQILNVPTDIPKVAKGFHLLFIQALQIQFHSHPDLLQPRWCGFIYLCVHVDEV